MRIPLYKTYRAFPEFDELTEAQCELLMRRVKLRVGTNMGFGCLLVLLYLVLLVILFWISLSLVSSMGIELDRFSGTRADLISIGIVITVFGVPALVCLVLRDTVLRCQLTDAISYEIDRVRCLNCKYILIGQAASGGRIGCPECGASFALGELGITEAELLPPGEPNMPTA